MHLSNRVAVDYRQIREAMMTASAIFQTVETPDGPFSFVVDDRGDVLASGWTADQGRLLSQIDASLFPDQIVEGESPVADIVAAYYEGDLEGVLEVPVKQAGTEFQQKGWSVLREIPAGDPLSYAEFAESIGNPAAVRAAGSVCARNSVALFVPCHRVIKSDGTLGNFGWGVDVKRSLLDRESQVSSSI